MTHDYSLNCTKCHEVVMKSHGPQMKVRAKVIIFKEDEMAYAICKGCSSEIPLPMTLDLNLYKSIAAKNEPLLYLKK